MTDLLDNELVRKYFGCDLAWHSSEGHSCDEAMALTILAAMHDPIREGDLVLELNGCDEPIGALEMKAPHDINPFHGLWLRVPQRFQPKPAEEKCHVHVFGVYCIYCDYKYSPLPAAPARECAPCEDDECSKHSRPKPPPPTERCGKGCPCGTTNCHCYDAYKLKPLQTERSERGRGSRA